MVYNGYYKVMSNIPKMGHLPTPVGIVCQYIYHKPVRESLELSSPTERDLPNYGAPPCNRYFRFVKIRPLKRGKIGGRVSPFIGPL